MFIPSIRDLMVLQDETRIVVPTELTVSYQILAMKDPIPEEDYKQRAKKLLDLCRKTIDDIYNPDVSKVRRNRLFENGVYLRFVFDKATGFFLEYKTRPITNDRVFLLESSFGVYSYKLHHTKPFFVQQDGCAGVIPLSSPIIDKNRVISRILSQFKKDVDDLDILPYLDHFSQKAKTIKIRNYELHYFREKVLRSEEWDDLSEDVPELKNYIIPPTLNGILDKNVALSHVDVLLIKLVLGGTKKKS